MNKYTKWITPALAAAILMSSAVVLAGCGTKGSAKDTEGSYSVNLTEATGTTTAAPSELPSMTPGNITINGEKISAAEYDFYYYATYSSYESYASYGAVPTVAATGAFDITAACTISGYESKTWGDYLKEIALTQLQDSYILAYYAGKDGVALSDDNQTTIDNFLSNVTTSAAQYGLTDDEYLKTLYGATATVDNLTPVFERYLLSSQYMTQLQDAYTFTDDELKAFYTANSSSYTDADLPVVRHILFLAYEGVSGQTDATQEELDKAKALADAALAKVNSLDDMVAVGEAALADGSAAESAQYTVTEGQMVDEFNDWCFDASRKVGDKAVIKTEYGYHVMYYVGTEKDWMADALSSLKSDKYGSYIKEQEALPMFAVTVN